MWGTSSGDRKNVSTAWRPGKRKRTRPIADSRPMAVATTAVTRPTTWLTRKNERTNVSLAKKAWYQRRDSPRGGKSKVDVGPNDTAITTTRGASKRA